MSPSSPLHNLPPLAGTQVTGEDRLEYVLRHFRLAYENVPPLRIGPGADSLILIPDQSGDFFTKQVPYPPAPVFRNCGGPAQLPFFFGGNPAQQLLEATVTGGVTIHADIISAAFYLLSGWQEYYSDVRDQHGRFPYAASVQKKYGFVALPLVNYYFDVLRAAVKLATGQELRPRRWGAEQAPFAAFVTHDIDNLNSGWGSSARQLLQRGSLAEAVALAAGWVLRRPAPWHNLDAVEAAARAHGASGTYFMLGSHLPADNGTRNADYQLTDPVLRHQLAAMVAAGAELGVHGSYGTANSPESLRHEVEQLLALGPVAGNRFHYLCWEPRLTPEAVRAAGFSYDSTLGFAEHYGFRHSYCLPFFPFDFNQGLAHRWLEIPLTLMDVTLHHPRYLQLQAHEILPCLVPVFEEIERFGGVATLLWHNENFSPHNEVNGPVQFHELMAYLRRRGAHFATGSEIVRHLCIGPNELEKGA